MDSVVAHAPVTPGEYGDIATRLLASTGATCVAVVTTESNGNGGYGVVGSLQTQMLMCSQLERAAEAVPSQLERSVQRSMDCAPRRAER